MLNRVLKDKEPVFTVFVIVYQRLTSRIRTADSVAHAALLLHVAGFAGRGLELAQHEPTTASVTVELTLGAAAAAEAGVAGAGLQEFELLVALDFVGRHGCPALVAGQLFGVVAHVAAGAGLAGAWLGARKSGARRLGVRRGGSNQTETAQQRGRKENFHISEKKEATAT